MKKGLSVFAAMSFVVAGALAGCSDASGDSAIGGGGSKGDTPLTPVTLETIAGTWTFENGKTSEGELEKPAGNPVEFVVEDDGSYHGTAGCNNIMGTLTVDEGAVDLGPAAATQMWCGDDEMAFETTYLGALEQITEGAVDGDTLTLEGPETELHYKRG